MVAHVWAQQDQDEGRSHNGNLWFEGTTLYSYGRHFPIGRFVQRADGGRAVLLNSDTYSVTTTAHQSRAAGAVYGLGLPTFRVPGCTDDHAKNLRHFEEAAVQAFTKADNPRLKRYRDKNLEAAAARLSEAKRYADTFGLKWKWKGADATAKRWAREARKAERERQQRREEAERQFREREARERARDLELFEQWRHGERDYAPASYSLDDKGSAYLRVKDDEVQTSRGARVPLEHAIRAFRFAKRVREQGIGWTADGRSIPVGHFHLTKISAHGDMTVGCHFLSWERIEEAAREAGVFDEPLQR